MTKKTRKLEDECLPAELELSFRNALKHGFNYVVATFKRSKQLGKPRVVVLFCRDQLDCQRYIRESEYRGDLSFNLVEIVLNSPGFFVRNR